jgi:hypothetical protein
MSVWILFCNPEYMNCVRTHFDTRTFRCQVSQNLTRQASSTVHKASENNPLHQFDQNTDVWGNSTTPDILLFYCGALR